MARLEQTESSGACRTHEVRDWRKIVELLPDTINLSANRAEFIFPIFELISASSLASLRAHYSDWPMYADGMCHQTMRRIMLRMLQEHEKHTIEIAAALIRVELSDLTTHPATEQIFQIAKQIHRAMLGSRNDKYESVYSHAKIIRDFFVYLDVPALNFTILEDALKDLKRTICAGGVGEPLRQLSISTDTIGPAVNLIGDTLEPMIELLNSVIGKCLEKKSTEVFEVCTNDDIWSETLCCHPPFRRINRRAIKTFTHDGGTIQIGDRVSFLLDEVLKMPAGKVVAFGVGPHACPAARLMKSISYILIDQVRSANRLQR
jgi:hypothetical protein